MGQISIRLTDKDEQKLKLLANDENKSLAEFCRDKILSDYHIDESLDRESVEEQIKELKNEISELYNITTFLLKKSTWNAETNRYFTNALFCAITKKPDSVMQVWKKAKESADEEVKKLFE